MTRDEMIAVARDGMARLERSLQALERADGYALDQTAQVVVDAAFVVSTMTTLARVMITMGKSASGSAGFENKVREANASRPRKGS